MRARVADSVQGPPSTRAPRPEPSPRILGWDVLRGLCAGAVAVYHLLLWLKVADGAAFGSYCVYMFFALSGASLAYTYGPALRDGRFRMAAFLWVRYLRLAPLYTLALVVSLPLIYWPGQWTPELLKGVALNLSFLFGFVDPAASALVIGGWSLGVEAVFYLMFPLVISALYKRRWAALVIAGAVALQLAWLSYTLGSPGAYADKAVAYHQVPAFAAYFVGGCAIGLATRAGHRWSISTGLGCALMLVGFGLIGLLNPAQQGDELWGWRAWVLAPLCLALTAAASGARWQGTWARVAERLGDATYGLYLLHPILFWGALALCVGPLGWGSPLDWPLAARLGWAGALLGLAFCLALLSERHFERPLREWSRRRASAHMAPRSSS